MAFEARAAAGSSLDLELRAGKFSPAAHDGETETGTAICGRLDAAAVVAHRQTEPLRRLPQLDHDFIGAAVPHGIGERFLGDVI